LRDLVGTLVAGVLIGGGVAVMVTGVARKIVFGLTPTEPSVFVVAASVLAFAVVLGGDVGVQSAAT